MAQPAAYPQGGPAPPGSQPIAGQPMAGGVPGAPMVPGGGVAPGGWANAPQVPADCPPGLQYLAQVDQLLVKQKLEVFEAFSGYETNNKYEVRNALGQRVYYAAEAFTGYETNNKYEVRNAMGQRVYYAAEDTCCCTRNCCGSSRPFDIKILDNTSKEVIHLSRPLRCSSCWCPCCLQKVTVEAPPGNVIGYVKQSWSLCLPKFAIQNAAEETVLRIEGPCCQFNICGDIEFDVTSADGDTHVGRISKQWSGLAKEVFTDADNFGISFPLDLDVKMKAVTLGATFLLDLMYFEEERKKDDKKDKD